MIICARCGAQNQPTNKFCLSCGAPVQTSAPGGQPGGANPPAPAPQNPNPGWGSPPAPSPFAPAHNEPQGGWGAPQHHQQPGHQPGPSPYGQPGSPGGPHQYGAPQQGLNPFGPTVGPDIGQHGQSPQHQHGGPQYGQPGQQGYPGQFGQPAPQQPQGGAQAWGQQPDAGYSPAAPNQDHGAPAQQRPPTPAAAPASPRPGRDPEQLDPNAPRALAGFLVSYESNELGTYHPIYQGQNLVGRKGAAQGLSIELEHGTTSSRHAMLLASARPGRVKLEDIGSTNGTFVGDLMLERGKKHELKDGDIVRFGGYVTIVKIV